MYGSSSSPGEDKGCPALPTYYTSITTLTRNLALPESLHTFSPSKPYSCLFCKHRFCSSFGSTHSKQKQNFTLVVWVDIVMTSKGKMWRVRSKFQMENCAWKGCKSKKKGRVWGLQSELNSEHPHFRAKLAMSELLSSENSSFIFTSNYHDLKWIIWSWRYSEVKKLPNIHYFCYRVGNTMPEAKIIFLHSSQRSGEGGSLQMCTFVTLDYFQFSAPA